MSRRDELLRLDDAALSALCTWEFFKGSGPGGQKRNKTSSAARVRLAEFDLSAEDCTERSQLANRRNALAKLRMRLALEVRGSPAAQLEVPFATSIRHPLYPLLAAGVTDHLEECSFDHRAAALRIGVTPTALLRKIAADPVWWSRFSARRRELGLPPLHP